MRRYRQRFVRVAKGQKVDYNSGVLYFLISNELTTLIAAACSNKGDPSYMSDRCHVLCVEDNADTCELIEAWLKYGDGSFTMESTADSKTALERIRSGTVDLVVIDSWLPTGSGIELCREIRKIDEKVPIMFFSGDVRKSAIEVGMAAGANLYLTKPATGEEFMAAVNKLTGYECQLNSPEKAAV